MTTASITQGSMTFKTTSRQPLHQRMWAFLVDMGARRAAAHLRREALMLGATQPQLSRQMRDAADHLSTP